MKNIFYILFLLTALQVKAQTGLPATGVTAADNLIKSFMTSYNIPGLTFAMSKNGKIIYMRAFGFSDAAKTVPVQPYNLFRIASVSKQITSIAIMKLMQDGKLSLSSKVFGPGGLLEHHPVISTAAITDTRIYNITVQQLLEHTAGWDRAVNCNANPTPPYPWFVGGCDPINNPLTVTATLGLPNPVTEDAYCKYMLQKGLNFDPGTKSVYSNMGYLFLGEIIEQVTGMSYEEYVKTSLLHPLGLYDTHIGGNLLSEKKEREVEYAGGEGTNLSIYGDGTSKIWEYGGMDVTAMSAHGGWITTARDLITLLNAVDGFNTKPDILSAATITTMTTPSTADPNYAKGWSVNTYNNWWHTGSITGTASEQVRAGNGYNWVIIMNHRGNTNAFWSALDNLGWNVQTAVSWGTNYDLMLAPTQNASGISFSNINSTSLTVNWTNGNGAKRLLAIRPEAAVNEFPPDGVDYTANAAYASATSLGGDVKVIYNGTGNSVTVTGLEAGKKYYFRLFEYNNNAASGNNSLYLRGSNAEASQSTAGALPLTLIAFNAINSDNGVNLSWTTSQEINTSHFEIQRSTTGNDFENIDNVTATGNSSVNTLYHFTDHLNAEMKNMEKIFYRLKMIDKDGSFTYSKIVSVNIKENNRFIISPNPAKNIVNIQGNNIAKIEVTGITGNQLIKKEYNNASNIQLNISRLSAGGYLMRITDKNGTVQSERLIIQK